MLDVRHVRMGLASTGKSLTLHRSLTIQEATSILHAGRMSSSAIVTPSRDASAEESQVARRGRETVTTALGPGEGSGEEGSGYRVILGLSSRTTVSCS
jgi:hypothetical protein